MSSLQREPDHVIRVKAETVQLAQIRRFVEEVAREVYLDDERMFDLKVAVCEACANALEHACDGSTLLEVYAHVDGSRLTFVVSDNGVFRPPNRPKEVLPKRGLGLPLMVALMDEVVFSRTPGGGTRVSLSVFLEQGRQSYAIH